MPHNKTTRIILTLALITFLAISVIACSKKGQESPNLPPMTVTFFHTQDDADCILFEQEDHAFMIDTGEKKDAAHILEVLKDKEITRLDCLILTHADKDHIGGAKKILKEISIGQVIEPAYDNGDWKKVNEAFEEQEVRVVKTTRDKRFKVGSDGLTVTVYPPMERQYDEENDYSLSVLVTYGNVNMLFTGDALAERSSELMQIEWPEIALFKVPHHGRVNAATESLMQTVDAEFAVVTAVECNEEIKACAEKVGTKLFCTGEGDVVFKSDGKVISVQLPVENE